jgi:cytoskeletal protein RodZ
VTSDVTQQVDDFVTPGTMLRSARLARELPSREVEDQLNLMPGYVDILERDDYQALRSPAFARGYVRAYGLLMELDQEELLAAFDEQRANRAEQKKRVETKPLQLQRTGAGVIVGLVILMLLFAGLWWWQGRAEPAREQPPVVAPAMEVPSQTSGSEQ